MKTIFVSLSLAFGVLALPAFLGGLTSAPPDAFVAPLPPRSEPQISESAAWESCKAAVGQALHDELTPQYAASAFESRPLDGDGILAKVTFSTKNSRNIDLEFGAWCEVWADGRTTLVSLIEIAGREYLASSHPPTVRNGYLQKMKIAKYQSDDSRFSAIMANRNDFSIKHTEFTCRITYSDPVRHEDKVLKIKRIIPTGGTATFQLARPSGAQSVSCRVTDFFKIGSDEQRLIEAFGQTGGQSSYARLRQDAMRVGIAVSILIDPYVTMARALAYYRR